MAFLLEPGLSYSPAPGVNPAEHRQRLRRYLWEKSGGCCALCGDPIEVNSVQADHIIPQARGGVGAVHNLQAAHRTCNSAKSHRISEMRIHRTIKAKTRQRPRTGAALLPYLKAWRILAALTQSQLASRIGIRRLTIHRLEIGGHTRLTTVRKLADALGCEPADLMGLDTPAS